MQALGSYEAGFTFFPDPMPVAQFPAILPDREWHKESYSGMDHYWSSSILEPFCVEDAPPARISLGEATANTTEEVQEMIKRRLDDALAEGRIRGYW